MTLGGITRGHIRALCCGNQCANQLILGLFNCLATKQQTSSTLTACRGVGQEPSTLGGDAVDGPPSSWYKFGLPTVTHSRFYEPTNDYVTGKAPDLPPDADQWVWINASTAAVSSSAEFFQHIFGRAQQGMGMATYEQDFLTKSVSTLAARLHSLR